MLIKDIAVHFIKRCPLKRPTNFNELEYWVSEKPLGPHNLLQGAILLPCLENILPPRILSPHFHAKSLTCLPRELFQYPGRHKWMIPKEELLTTLPPKHVKMSHLLTLSLRRSN